VGASSASVGTDISGYDGAGNPDCGFFAAHAVNIFKTASNDDTVENAKYILKKILGLKKPSVSIRTVLRACNGRLGSIQALDPGLRILTERGYIQMYEITAGPRGGRPTTIIDINPVASIG
jgi:hypothetical protein